ncbi:MAG TPA: hypothetical protein VF418_10280 [Sphingomonadaceae bacterium]
MKLRLFALALFLASSMPATAAPIDKIAGWSIYRNEDNCSAYSVFSNNELFGIAYDASDRSTKIVFTNADAKSLDEGDTRTIDIYLKRADGTIDNSREGTEFTLGVDSDGSRVFVSRNLAEPALADLKNATAIVLFYKDRKIAAYNLAGTAAALSAVERCSMKVHHIDPKDVFAGESSGDS